MKVIIADDDQRVLKILEKAIGGWGHEVVKVSNGLDAWAVLSQIAPPWIALLDWVMPEIEGVQICRDIRARKDLRPIYLILLTGRSNQKDVLEGFAAGADDYIVKPFDVHELRARIEVGLRTIAAEQALSERMDTIEVALAHIKQLEGLLPICSECKRIRDENGVWHDIETYITEHSEAQFTHGLCPCCRNPDRHT
jgi:phosphoserine phosphatase RsbU/P